MTDKTKDDRQHELKLLIWGFVLTTVTGGLLSFFFQELQEGQKVKADERSENARIMEQRQLQATELFNELSPIIDTRLYNWRRLAWGIEDQIPEDSLKKRYLEYQEVFLKWNRNLNRNRALVCRFFGPDLLENNIVPQFRNLQIVIMNIYNTPRASRPAFNNGNLDCLSDSLNEVIYEFNNSMAESIRSGQVGLMDPGKSCDLRYK
jgi:hypothetical protein